MPPIMIVTIQRIRRLSERAMSARNSDIPARTSVRKSAKSDLVAKCS